MKNNKEIFEYLVNKTEQYLRENNLFTMVLGISGGIDSTLTAAICHEVEKRNEDFSFIGVSLPCSTNSHEENMSAQTCGNAFCKKGNFWTENLQKEYMLMRSTCYEHGGITTIGAGNIKARLRMIYLYDMAQKSRGLVMDTDNLTEHYLGFFTIHGDVADFNPIGCLWKHEIYELVWYLHDNYYTDDDKYIKEALYRSIIILPTDGNGVMAGGDMAQIAPGFTYNDVDDVLINYLAVKGYDTEKEVLEMLYNKYSKEMVDGIIKRHKSTEFKRKRLPIATDRKEISQFIQ